MADDDDIPQDFLCPISQSIMVDPVTIPQCGHTFDRQNLMIWLHQTSNCPTCRTPVDPRTPLVTNFTLKNIIDSRSGALNNTPVNPNANASARRPAEVSLDVPVDESDLDGEILKKIKATIMEKDDLIHLQLKTPAFVKRRPVSIVCLIDVSGSMGSIVGKAEGSKAFIRLDLVKHVLNVLIQMLGPLDHLALVRFSDQTYKDLDLSPMNDDNKRLARNIVRQMIPMQNTYTSPAIKIAYEIMQKSPANSMNSILLFTDGQDTAGEDMFNRTFDRIKKPDNIQFSTFGFSNEIWSYLLQNLSIKGGGIFGYIPDQTMIGTIFINVLANTFLTFAQNVTMKLDENFEIDTPKRKSDKFSLYYGQSRHFLIKRKNNVPKHRKPVLELSLTNHSSVRLEPEESRSEENFKIQLARKKMLEFLTDPKLPRVDLKGYQKSPELSPREFLSEFMQTGEYDPNFEQMALALKEYDKWGQHYIRSMYSAHYNEQSLNFKSPSMQIYENEQFKDIVDKITDLFITLPLPEPSGTCIQSANNVPEITQDYLMDRHGGCILGTCNIKMENGEYKPIHSLKKDDVLFGGSKIVCLVKSKHLGSLAKIGRLYITLFHPVFVGDQWQFPYDIVTSKSAENTDLILGPLEHTYVFNIVLDKHHIVDVEGVGCITLGHMYDEGILKHDYFGTNKVIEDLSKLNGWNEGFISLQSYKIQRDSNGLICGSTDHVYNCVN